MHPLLLCGGHRAWNYPPQSRRASVLAFTSANPGSIYALLRCYLSPLTLMALISVLFAFCSVYWEDYEKMCR